MKTWEIITIVTVISVTAVLVTSVFAIASFGNSPYGGISGFGDMMGASTSDQTFSINQTIQMMQNTPSYAKVSPSTNTITFDSQDISILVLPMMPDKAANLTGMQPPSYSTGDVFVIDGLINPSLLIPDGSIVHFTVVNLDDDMYHNLVVTPEPPPYPYSSMNSMMSSVPFLPPADYAQGWAYGYSYNLSFGQSGTLWYICTYPGHAQAGMYGQIVVSVLGQPTPTGTAPPSTGTPYGNSAQTPSGSYPQYGNYGSYGNPGYYGGNGIGGGMMGGGYGGFGMMG